MVLLDRDRAFPVIAERVHRELAGALLGGGGADLLAGHADDGLLAGAALLARGAGKGLLASAGLLAGAAVGALLTAGNLLARGTGETDDALVVGGTLVAGGALVASAVLNVAMTRHCVAVLTGRIVGCSQTDCLQSCVFG